MNLFIYLNPPAQYEKIQLRALFGNICHMVMHSNSKPKDIQLIVDDSEE